VLKEVVPIQYHGSFAQVFSYERIRVENLTKETLRRCYTFLELARPVYILETPAYFLIQYEKKPVIILKKEDGRLYSLPGQGFPRKEIEHQASFVIRILKKFDLIEGVRSKKVSLKKKRGDLDGESGENKN